MEPGGAATRVKVGPQPGPACGRTDNRPPRHACLAGLGAALTRAAPCGSIVHSVLIPRAPCGRRNQRVSWNSLAQVLWADVRTCAWHGVSTKSEGGGEPVGEASPLPQVCKQVTNSNPLVKLGARERSAQGAGRHPWGVAAPPRAPRSSPAGPGPPACPCRPRSGRTPRRPRRAGPAPPGPARSAACPCTAGCSSGP